MDTKPSRFSASDPSPASALDTNFRGILAPSYPELLFAKLGFHKHPVLYPCLHPPYTTQITNPASVIDSRLVYAYVYPCISLCAFNIVVRIRMHVAIIIGLLYIALDLWSGL